VYDRNQKKNMKRRVVNSMKKEKKKGSQRSIILFNAVTFSKRRKITLLQAKCYIASIIYNNMISSTTTVLFKGERFKCFLCTH
jgi:hypothetical protein